MTKHYEQRKTANERYLAKFEKILLRLAPEEKENIKAHADSLNESVNGFVLRAIRETIQRDNAPQD